MARWGISGKPVAAQLPYAAQVTRACANYDFPPCFAYAIAVRETIRGEQSGWLVTAFGPGTTAANVLTADGGHGLMQLTSSYPDTGWDDPFINADFAVRDFLMQLVPMWFIQYGFTGDDLVRSTAASYNAGWQRAVDGHVNYNDVDHFTTKDVTFGAYGGDVLHIYHLLVAGQSPFG